MTIKINSMKKTFLGITLFGGFAAFRPGAVFYLWKSGGCSRCKYDQPTCQRQRRTGQHRPVHHQWGAGGKFADFADKWSNCSFWTTRPPKGSCRFPATTSIWCLGGYNTNIQTASWLGFTSTNVFRAVATIDGFGNYALPITNANIYSTFNLRGAASDGSNFWVSGSGGTGASIANGELGIIYVGNPALETNVTVTETGTGNERVVNIYNNTLYLSTGSGSGTFGRGIYVVSNLVSSGLPTNTGSLVNNSNIMQTGSGGGPYDFVINSASTNAYVAEDNLGGIVKFTSSGPGGLWVSNYTISPLTSGVTRVRHHHQCRRRHR